MVHWILDHCEDRNMQLRKGLEHEVVPGVVQASRYG
jgi:hypothetical protein